MTIQKIKSKVLSVIVKAYYVKKCIHVYVYEYMYIKDMHS